LGYLRKVVNANGKIAASFNYDAFGRIATYTDSEGWTVSYVYDAADRVTQITYPDGTTDRYFYDKLDLAMFEDRQGRIWSYAHDANRRLVAVTDPLGNQTQFGYTGNGRLKRLTDPNGNVTKWTYDVAGRAASKIYADATQVAYAYETTTSRLKSVTDALGQTKQYTYTLDDRAAGFSYLNALNPTPNVSFAWATHWPQISAMTDGTGTTQYSYVPVGLPGARKLQQETGPLPSAAIAYTYDALGRVASRTLGGAGPETFQYDAIGRLVDHAHDLGEFALSYLEETGQVAQRQLVGGTTATKWGYLDNTGDRRLAVINNVGLRKYQYTTTPENLITGIPEKSCYSLPCSPLRNWSFGYDAAGRLVSAMDSSAVAPYGYTLDPAGSITQFQSPTAATKAATYNTVNELTSLAGQPFAYDANGNLVSDGQRNYAWDAENRLVKINNISSGTKTVFAYDGRDRRAAMTTTTAGSPTTQYHLWCGARPCQLRNTDNTVARSFYTEGELIAGSATRLYYGPDQLGSVRDARAVGTASTTVQAYNYDRYGNPTQSLPPGMQARFRYAGMFYHQDSGLYLTQYRAYDPRTARWLTRDPLGESASENLYGYVRANPIKWTDRLGLDVDVIVNDNDWIIGTHVGIFVGTPGSPDSNVLYDPGGHYKNNERGSGDAFWGDEADLSDYSKFQKDDGPDVRVFHFPTTPAEDDELRKRIGEGGCPAGLCAFCSGNVLRGIGPFKNLGSTKTPAGMGRELQNLIDGLKPKMTPIPRKWREPP
jgi:RHS repeat-associated protein